MRWTVVASPNPPSVYLNMLWGVSAVSGDNIWAVGTTDYTSTLIVHWNGRPGDSAKAVTNAPLRATGTVAGWYLGKWF